MKFAAVIQMVSKKNIDDNLESAHHWLNEASRQGADLAVLPENFAVFSVKQMTDAGIKESETNGRIRSFLSSAACDLGMWIVGGTVPCALRPDGTAVENRLRSVCRVYDSTGSETARYDKIHLFDADVSAGLKQYRESDTFEHGEKTVTADTPLGRLGLAVCYDLRFAELFLGLRRSGADIITLPSAFIRETGDAHWEPLIRARAIETQTWILAANQGGVHSRNQETSGDSMIVDPWGRVVNRIQRGEGIIISEIDSELTAQVRGKMPVHNHRRLDAIS